MDLFELNGTDCASHNAQSNSTRLFIVMRNHHAIDPSLRKVNFRTSLFKCTEVA